VSTVRLEARRVPVELSAGAKYLHQMVWSAVNDGNCDALTEFHSAGIPLGEALSQAVRIASRPMIEHLLSLKVPCDAEVLDHALTRGVSIRRWFLARVAPVPTHMDTALKYGHYDSAAEILERGVLPSVSGLRAMHILARSGAAGIPAEFLLRLVSAVPAESLDVTVLKRLAQLGTVGVLERALERSQVPKQEFLAPLLEIALREDRPPLQAFLLAIGAPYDGKVCVEILRAPDYVCGSPRWGLLFTTCTHLLSRRQQHLARANALELLDLVCESSPCGRSRRLRRVALLSDPCDWDLLRARAQLRTEDLQNGEARRADGSPASFEQVAQLLEEVFPRLLPGQTGHTDVTPTEANGPSP
jgi:hypothetical protein